MYYKASLCFPKSCQRCQPHGHQAYQLSSAGRQPDLILRIVPLGWSPALQPQHSTSRSGPSRIFGEWRVAFLPIDLKWSCLWSRHPSCPLITNPGSAFSEPPMSHLCPQPTSALREMGTVLPPSWARHTCFWFPSCPSLKLSGAPSSSLGGAGAQAPLFTALVSAALPSGPVPAWPGLV